MNDPEVIALRNELRRHRGDIASQIEVALEHGYCPSFVPIEHEGEPALAFGIWQGCPLDQSPDLTDRAVAAVIYCDWTLDRVA